MENNREAQYDFCPKCGALARGGVCTSCGFGSAPVEAVAPVIDEVPVVTAAEPVVAEAESVQKIEETPVEEIPVENPYVSYSEQTVNVSQNPYTTPQNTYIIPNASVENQQTINNAAQSSSQGGYYGSPYSEYANRTVYTNGAIPPDVPQKKGNGKVWAVVLTCVGLFILLIILLGVAIYNLISKIEDGSNGRREEEVWSEDYDFDDFEYDLESDDYDNYDDYNDYDDYDYDEFYNDIMERAK